MFTPSVLSQRYAEKRWSVAKARNMEHLTVAKVARKMRNMSRAGLAWTSMRRKFGSTMRRKTLFFGSKRAVPKALNSGMYSSQSLHRSTSIGDLAAALTKQQKSSRVLPMDVEAASGTCGVFTRVTHSCTPCPPAHDSLTALGPQGWHMCSFMHRSH